MPEFTRVVAISDTHCGSRVGLTPPEYDQNAVHEDELPYQRARQEQWAWFAAEIEALRRDHPIDMLFHLGDAVDGSGWQQNGRDVIWQQPRTQVAMAERVIKFINASAVRMVCGTAYHVDNDDNVERQIAEKVGATFKPLDEFKIRGMCFNLKHDVKAGDGALPRVRLNNALAEQRGDAKAADIILRGHVHRYRMHGEIGRIGIGDPNDHYGVVTTYTLPALCGPGSEYGLKMCDGPTDFGFMHFDVFDDFACMKAVHAVRLESQVRVAPELVHDVDEALPAPARRLVAGNVGEGVARGQIFGYSATAIVRALGAWGLGRDHVMRVLAVFGVVLSPESIPTQLYYGRVGKKPVPALTDEQQAELKRAAEDGPLPGQQNLPLDGPVS